MKKLKMRNKLLLVGFLAMSLVLSFVIAEEADQKPEEVEAQAPEPTSESSSSTASPNRTFRPTEEISEDLPVSFPADI